MTFLLKNLSRLCTGKHIISDICFPGGETHITRDMCFPGRRTHITRDMCFPGREHVSQEIRDS